MYQLDLATVHYIHQVSDIVLPLTRLDDLQTDQDRKFSISPVNECFSTLIEIINATSTSDYPRIVKQVADVVA